MDKRDIDRINRQTLDFANKVGTLSIISCHMDISFKCILLEKLIKNYIKCLTYYYNSCIDTLKNNN